MFEFKSVTNRIQRLRKKYRDTLSTLDAERTRIVTDYYRKSKHVTPYIRRANTLYEILSKMTVRVEADELIVGNIGKYYHACALAAEYRGVKWLADELKSGEFDQKTPADGLAFMDEEDRAYMCSQDVIDFWLENDLSAILDANMPEEFSAVVSAGVLPHRPSGNGSNPHGHFNANYAKAADKGFGAVRREAMEKLEGMKGNIWHRDAEKYFFYQGVVISCDAIILFSRRYAAECRRQAENMENGGRRDELLSMASSLDWIMENPARTFREALQVVLLYHFVLTIEGSSLGLALGRIDQHVGKYLEADIEAGLMTMDEAQELMDCFFLKMAEICLAAPVSYMRFFGAYTSNQRLTIAGRKKDGSDATNQATYLCLQSAARLKLHDPTLSLCLHKDSPGELWEAGIETVKMVGGIPTFENTDLIIRLLHERGLAIEDARNFCVVGCIELTGSGCEFANVSGQFSKTFTNISNCLLQAINNGINPMNGKKGGLETGYLYEMETFAEVKDAFRKQLEYFVNWQFTIGNIFEYIGNPQLPVPMASATMDGCMESGCDMVLGGAKYNSTGMANLGIGTVADSLSAIRYLVYDKKICTVRELYDAVMDNWVGHEKLRQRALNESPRYGNGDLYADELASWVMDLYASQVNAFVGPRGQYRAGTYSAGGNLITGYGTYATPNGRKSGEVVSDGASPTHGADTCGPISLVSSIIALHPEKYPNGFQFCMRFHPSSLQGEEGVQKMQTFIETFFEEGGMQMQVNVISADTLRAAQTNPDEYRDLVVRVAGFSAYFIELYKDLQDDIILRTDNML